MKFAELATLFPGYQKLAGSAEVKLHRRIPISREFRAVQDAMGEMANQERMIMEKYQGALQEDGRIEFPDHSSTEQFMAERGALMDEESGVTLAVVTQQDLVDAGLTPADMAPFWSFITEADNEQS